MYTFLNSEFSNAIFLSFSFHRNLLSGSRCAEHTTRVLTLPKTARFGVKRRSAQRHGGSDRLAAPLHVRLKRSLGNSHASIAALKCFSVTTASVFHAATPPICKSSTNKLDDVNQRRQNHFTHPETGKTTSTGPPPPPRRFCLRYIPRLNIHAFQASCR